MNHFLSFAVLKADGKGVRSRACKGYMIVSLIKKAGDEWLVNSQNLFTGS
jgi:hypothetical protein